MRSRTPRTPEHAPLTTEPSVPAMAKPDAKAAPGVAASTSLAITVEDSPPPKARKLGLMGLSPRSISNLYGGPSASSAPACAASSEEPLAVVSSQEVELLDSGNRTALETGGNPREVDNDKDEALVEQDCQDMAWLEAFGDPATPEWSKEHGAYVLGGMVGNLERGEGAFWVIVFPNGVVFETEHPALLPIDHDKTLMPVSKAKAKAQAEEAVAKGDTRKRLRSKTNVLAKAAAAKAVARSQGKKVKKGKTARSARKEVDEVLGKAKVLGREKGHREKYIVHFCPDRKKLRYVGSVAEAQSLNYKEICEQAISRV